jgi:peptidoglycan hydrolase CwlO-like protein
VREELGKTKEEVGKAKEEVRSMREELSYLKNLLTEKTLEIKEREEECLRLRARPG